MATHKKDDMKGHINMMRSGGPESLDGLWDRWLCPRSDGRPLEDGAEMEPLQEVLRLAAL